MPKFPDWWPCHFWDTKVNNPFWSIVNWVLHHLRLWDLVDYISEGNDEHSD